MEQVLFEENVKKTGLVPVVVIENVEDAVPTARALLAGGIGMMEITFRTACAAEAISRVAEEVPEMLVGAGTVTDLQKAQDAVAAGAGFIVSPGFSEEIVRWCTGKEIPVVPGCVTPTEIMAAIACGLHVVKYFPANLFGGIKAIKTLSGVFGGIRFLPTGGVNAENLPEFVSEKSILAVGGSWVCTAKDIREGNFGRITSLCREALEIIRNTQEENT